MCYTPGMRYLRTILIALGFLAIFASCVFFALAVIWYH